MDADMTTITIEDFGALVSDLVTAMGTAGVTADDQTAILTVLGSLCDQIVVGAGEKNKCMGNSEDELIEAPDLALMLMDDAYNGTLETMVCTDMVITDNPDLPFTGNVQLTVGMDHTYIGDVTIKVVSPAGTILTVLQRPGNTNLPDNGTSCCNDNSDLAKGFPITFKNGGTTDATKMGATLPAAGVVCKDDLFCEYNTKHLSGPASTSATSSARRPPARGRCASATATSTTSAPSTTSASPSPRCASTPSSDRPAMSDDTGPAGPRSRRAFASPRYPRFTAKPATLEKVPYSSGPENSSTS
jgi:hypothetical protein